MPNDTDRDNLANDVLEEPLGEEFDNVQENKPSPGDRVQDVKNKYDQATDAYGKYKNWKNKKPGNGVKESSKPSVGSKPSIDNVGKQAARGVKSPLSGGAVEGGADLTGGALGEGVVGGAATEAAGAGVAAEGAAAGVGGAAAGGAVVEGGAVAGEAAVAAGGVAVGWWIILIILAVLLIVAILMFLLGFVIGLYSGGSSTSSGSSASYLSQPYISTDGKYFPLTIEPQNNFTAGSTRGFGDYRRHANRHHAGIDLIAPAGTPIRSIDNGTVVNFYDFYSGTYCLFVDYGDYVINYGEISGVANGVSVGSTVSAGQVIAYVGRLNSGSSMLHLEMYKSGTTTNTQWKWGAAQPSNLENPTDFITRLLEGFE